MQLDYPEEYVEKIFYLWYSGGKKQGNPFINSIPETSDGRKPSKFTVISWIKNNGWLERADALDAEVSRSLDTEVINKRIQAFEEAVVVADELITLGRNYLKEHGKGIQSDNAAIRAIDLGLATKRISTGMAEMYTKISQMSDESITKELLRLIGKKDDIINAEIEELDE